MISMYSDAALEQHRFSRTTGRSINLRRSAARDRNDFSSAKSSPGNGVSSLRAVDPPSGNTLHDDSLDAPRGMALAIVLGLGCWMLIGGLARLLLF